METVQGGVPPYGVKETLVVNGGKLYVVGWSVYFDNYDIFVRATTGYLNCLIFPCVEFKMII